MQVHEAMTEGCKFVDANDTIRHAAQIMAEEGVGCLPVAENDRLIGMLTDRDIVTRCLARGFDGSSPVRDATTHDVKYCFEDEELDHVLDNMMSIQVRRIPVMSREKRIVGFMSLSDAARKAGEAAVGKAFCGITAQGGAHAGEQMKGDEEPLDNGIPMSQAGV